MFCKFVLLPHTVKSVIPLRLLPCAVLPDADVSSHAVSCRSSVIDNGSFLGVCSPLSLKDVVTYRKSKKGQVWLFQAQHGT